MNEIIGIGPFLGSFEYEIFNFWPWINWLNYILKPEKIYISSHFNRKFLYNEILKDENDFLPILDFITRDEINQKRFVYTKLNHKEFTKLNKFFQNCIQDFHLKRKLKFFNLTYSRSQFQVSNFNKIWTFPDYNFDKDKYKDSIVFIPHKIITENFSNLVYQKLNSIYNNIIVLGDLKTHLLEFNNNFNNLSFYQDNYIDIFTAIKNCRILVCPASHWTLLGNLVNKRIFTWGPNAGQYKMNEIFNFENKNCFSLVSDKKTPSEMILKSLEYFIKRNI